MLRIKWYYPLLAIFGFLVWFNLYKTKEVDFKTHGVFDNIDFSHISGGYIVTVLAVVIGTYYECLRKQSEEGNLQMMIDDGFLKSVFASKVFWKSLLVSPIFFAFLWKYSYCEGAFGLVAIGFQNGFCCTVITSILLSLLEKKQNKLDK